MQKYEIGQTIDSFKNHQEGVYFDLDDSGATLLVFFSEPTQEEIEQFKSGKNFEIRFTELYGIIMITIKIGSLNWMDAPYTPHLSKNLTTLQLPCSNQGIGLTLIMVDAATGKIKHLRLMGLNERFTRELFGAVMEQKMKGFNKIEYNKTLDKIFSTYKTSQIVKLSRSYCRINN